MYLFESKGIGNLKQSLFTCTNGKHWSDVQINMWKDMIKEYTTTKKEIYSEMPNEFHFWLDKVL